MLKPSAIVGSAFLLVSLVMLTDACSAQGGVTWTQLSPANSPSPRWQHAMVYDAARQRIVLFGGTDSTYSLQGTSEWDGANWVQATPAQSPPARWYHAMAYDAARQRVVLFGGSECVLGYCGSRDTWEWDGVIWTLRMPTQSPPARVNHAMAYDASRQRVVLFGGEDTSGIELPDTWEWDGVNWVQATPAQNPPARYAHAIAYDAARQRVVLFGGLDRHSPSYFRDTWEWDGVNWEKATPAQSPPGRYHPAMTYDAARQRVVLMGGGVWGINYSNSMGDQWEWDGSTWIEVVPGSWATRPREKHGMAYDEFRRRTIVFGGIDSWDIGMAWEVTILQDTWECSSLSPASLTFFGTGCPGTAGTPTLNAAPFSSPWTGDAFSLELNNLPATSMTFMVTGLSNTFWTSALLHLPAPLMSWGMPGCTVYTDVLDSELLANTTGTATWAKLIPTDPLLVGLTFYNQGFVIDPGVNAMGATVSNAGAATIGMR